MKILVTGSHGYIGKAVIHKLQKLVNSVQVIQVDRKIGKTFEDIKGEEFDAIIHLAASISVEESEIDKVGYINNNVINTISLLNNNKFNQFVFPSTNAIFNPEGKIQPSSVYGATKLVIEDYLMSNFYDKSAVVRIANPIGLKQYHSPILKDLDAETATVLYKMALCKIENRVFQIHDLKGMIRDFVEIETVADLLVDLTVNVNDSTGIFQIGSGVDTDVVRTLNDLCQRFKIECEYVTPPVGIDEGFVMDSSMVHKRLGFTTYKYDFVAYFQEYLDVLDKNGKPTSVVTQGVINS